MKRRSIRVKRAQPEHESQKQVVQWAKANEAKWPELALLFAVPNGARVAMRTAIKLKAEGMKAGVPDLWLPVPKTCGWQGDLGHSTGLVIEMKAPKGRLSSEQADWLHLLDAQGWSTAVCYSADEAIAILTRYITEGHI